MHWDFQTYYWQGSIRKLLQKWSQQATSQQFKSEWLSWKTVYSKVKEGMWSLVHSKDGHYAEGHKDLFRAQSWILEVSR